MRGSEGIAEVSAGQADIGGSPQSLLALACSEASSLLSFRGIEESAFLAIPLKLQIAHRLKLVRN